MENTTKARSHAKLLMNKILMENDDEVVYVAMKDESNEDEETTLMTNVNKNDRWIIDSGCSHHMTRDKIKFITLTSYD